MVKSHTPWWPPPTSGKRLLAGSHEPTGPVIEAIQLLGPADLSYNEVGKILSEKSGRPIRYTRLAANEYRESLLQIGYQQSAANALIAMFAAIEQGIAKAEARDPLNTAPTTFKSWARDNLSPLLK